jgi:hypothetical protein
VVDAHSARRWPGGAGSRLSRAVTTAFLVATAVLAPALPASAATIDCTPMGETACRSLTPVVECVWPETDGTRTVVWVYDNPSDTVLHIDVGNKNGMTPGADDQGQPTEFAVGSVRNVFTTNVTGTSASWRLGNITASLSDAAPLCPTKPVSQVGNLFALALYLLAVTVAVPVAVRPRRRVLPATGRSAPR